MNGLPDLTERRLQPELMDSPSLDLGPHLEALDALERVGLVSLAGWRTWHEVLRLAREGVQPVRVLDLACGGGDVLLSVARRAARAGVEVDLHGCDLSSVALERAGARGGDALGVTFHEWDVLRASLPEGYDLLTSSLFLHHLTRDEAVGLLSRMADAAGKRIFIQDLRRTPVGHVFARVGLGVLTRSPVARHDGRISVESAFTMEEVRAVCHDAGLTGAQVRSCWPQRFTVRWERP